MTSKQIVADLREIADSSYGFGLSPTQVRRTAARAAESIERLERRIADLKSAVDRFKEDEQ